MEYYHRLIEIALGWLHWPLDIAETCDVNAILVAYEGHKDMLYFIFGKSPPTPQSPTSPGKAPPLTPAAFDSIFIDERPSKIRGKRKSNG